MLKIACLARSAVGRVSRPSGAASLTPLWLPASIRIGLSRRIWFCFRFLLQLQLSGNARLLCRLLLNLGRVVLLVLRRLDAELVLQHLALHLFDLAGLEVAELERTVGEADQAADRPTEMAAEIADLAVLAFGQRHGQPGIVALLPVEARLHRAVADAFDRDALAQLVEM